MNYLNNRDMLAEIHKSKNSYSQYIGEGDHDYDVILDYKNCEENAIEEALATIDEELIEQAKINRSERLCKRRWQEAKDRGEKVKQADFAIDPKTIEDTEVIFRIYTFDHIPLAPGRKKNPKTVKDKHVKLNFIPFQHFKLVDGEFTCVGKSHWTGGVGNGYFSLDDGRITDKLGSMFQKLAKRYSNKWNWRGYSYNEEMQGQALLQLCEAGLQFDESKSSNAFAYYTTTLSNSFTRILNGEKKNQDIRDDILEMNNMTPSNSRQMENENDGVYGLSNNEFYQKYKDQLTIGRGRKR